MSIDDDPGALARTSFPRWPVQVAAALTMIIGTVMLGAWLSGAAARWSAGGGIIMKTNLALALVLAGLALVLGEPGQKRPPLRLVAATLSVFLLVLGALTGSEHLFRCDLGIDQILATEFPGAVATASPNRMGPPASVTLVLLGAGLLALALGRRRIAPYLGLSVCLVNLLPTVGYLYEIEAFYGKPHLTGIAWPSVVGLMSLGLGLMLAHPEGGGLVLLRRHDAGGALLRRLVPAAVLIPLGLGFLHVMGERRGVFGMAMGTGMLVLTLILLFTFLLWRSAARLSLSDRDQQRATQALRDQKEWLQVTLYSIGDAVITTDAGGSVLKMNPVAEALTGCSEVAARGRLLSEVFKIVNEETRAEVESPVSRVLREGVVVGLANHTLLIAKDGTERPIADSGAPIRDEKDEITGVVLVFRDQTEERAAQRALAHSESTFRDALRYLDEGYYSVTVDGLLIDHNLAFNRILGFDDAADLKGQPSPNFWQDPDDRKEYITRLMAEGVIANYQANAKTIRGDRIVVLLHAHLVRDEKGQLTRIDGSVTDYTERKRADEALRASEARYKTVVDNIPQKVFMKGRDFRWISSNSLFARDLGKKPEDIVGKVDYDLFPKDLADKYRADDKRIMETGATDEFDEEYLDKGERRIVHTIKTPVRDEAGTISGVLGVFWDITERKRLEEELRHHRDHLEETVRERTAELRDSEEHIRTTLYAIGDGVIATDAASRVTRMNPVAEKLTGWSEAQALSQPIAQVFHIVNEETRAEVENPVEHVLRVGTVVGLANHTVVISKDGAERPIADSGAPIRNEKGEITGVVLVFRDQTEERVVQKALHDSEQRLAKETAAIAEIVGEMLSGDLTDAETERQVLNACLDATGSTYGMIGTINQHGKYDATTYDSRTTSDCAFPEALAREMTTGMEIRGIWGWPMTHGKPLLCNNPQDHSDRVGQPQGHVPIESFLGVPVKREGTVTGMVAVANKPGGYTEADEQTLARLVDVMVVSRQHRELLTELEQRVHERTAQLEESNKELEGFSYSVSHDLRAPLRAIDGFTRILADDYAPHLNTEGKRLCSVVRENTGRMSRLIDDLLTFSRLGRTEMQPSEIDMGGMARAVYHEVTTPEHRARIDLQLEMMPPVVGDPSLMRQVWINLLGNAVKFSSKRERVVITVSGETKDGEKVFSVRDNGAGFDMQYVGKLFGVFQRLHSSKEFEGTGVGLALVQRVIRRHGGRVWAEGEPDRGATFYFALPQKGT